MYKMPNDLKEILEALHSDEKDITIGGIEAIRRYIRQYDASFYCSTKIEKPETEDALTTMQTAGEDGCNYVLILNTDDVYERYEQAGFVPYMVTDDYLVYEVTGVDYVVKYYDSKRRLSRIEYYNAEGVLSDEKKGYFAEEYKYDSKLRRIGYYYYDENNNRMTLSNGMSGVEWQYDKDGNKIKKTFVDEENQPVNISKGYAVEKYTYNDEGLLIETNYLDINEQPVETNKGYQRMCYEYDESGEIAKKVYYNINGEVVDLE